MEDNSKELRAAPSAPLYRLLHTDSGPVQVLNLSKCLFFLSLWTLVLHFTGLGTACYYHFECTRVLPSPVYLSTFTYGARWEIAAAVSYTGLIATVNQGAYARLKGVVSKEHRDVLYILGVVVCVLLPLLPVLNDVNSYPHQTMEQTQRFLYYSLLVLLFLWFKVLVSSISLLHSHFNRSETHWFLRLQWTIRLFISLLGLMLFQWKFAYTAQSRFLLNAWALEACTWVLSAFFVVLPVLAAQLFRGFYVYIPVSPIPSLDP